MNGSLPLRVLSPSALPRARRSHAHRELDEIHAAILRVKLRHLEEWIAERRRRAALYAELLTDASVALPAESELTRHSSHLYVVRSPRRETLLRRLEDRGIGAAVHYPTPVHLQPAYATLDYRSGDFPEAERACAEVLSLPLYPELTEEEVRRIAAVVRAAD